MARQPLSLLVVDDDGDDVELLEDTLSEMRGYEAKVTWVPTYEQALRADHDAYDAILLDYKLGAHSGLDLLKLLAEMGVRAPLILLTGLDDASVDTAASTLGAADYLVKGAFDAPTLERSLRYSLAWGRLVDELRQKETNQRKLIDAAFDGLVVHDAKGRVLHANETAVRLAGKPLEGASIGEILPLPAIMARATGTAPEGLAAECEMPREDGAPLAVEWQCKPIWQDGQSVVLTCFRDVTPRKQMQDQLLERERLVTAGLLASSLAHEIGTPLAVMRGRTEMLDIRLRGLPVADALASKSLSVILEQIDRITRLIRTLLSYMRGGGEAAPTEVSVCEALYEAVDLLTGELRGKGVSLRIEVPAEARVRAEPDGLRQVFVNLLVNAVHAIEKAASNSAARPREIHVKAHARTEGVCEVMVRDTGCGIPAANLESIFVPFFTTKERGKGTGLGLAIVQQALVKWGGGVEVESTEGVGTTFHLRLRAC